SCRGAPAGGGRQQNPGPGGRGQEKRPDPPKIGGPPGFRRPPRLAHPGHRRVAAANESPAPAAADENAALIAEHLEAAGDLHAAYGWHMRAGVWALTRDVAAAWASWQRARQVADALPADDSDRLSIRIAPRAWLCASAFRVHVDISGDRFDELQELCTAAGDKPSLVDGMAGLIAEHLRHGRVREASRLASETMALVESIGKPDLTGGGSLATISTKFLVGEMAEALRWSQTLIELAPVKWNGIHGSPLAVALA